MATGSRIEGFCVRYTSEGVVCFTPPVICRQDAEEICRQYQAADPKARVVCAEDARAAAGRR